MLQGFGIHLGLKLLLRRHARLGAKFAIYPVNYWRHAEYAAALRAIDLWQIDPPPGMRVLDVGSPKLLSLYLAVRRGFEVTATDLHDYFISDCRIAAAALGIADSRYRLQTADGRALPYPSGSFDFIYSISVVEHIPDEGDAHCLRELGRVLRPGGQCIVTVPFAPHTRDEYRAPDFYWAENKASRAPKSSTAPNQPTPVFFQRRYDEHALQHRLIAPSGLRPVSLRYIGERVLTGSTTRQLSDILPSWLGPLHGLAAALCLTTPQPDWKLLKKPLCAVIVLEKV